MVEPNHPNPLLAQGLFVSRVTPAIQQISFQYLAPSPSAQPNDRTLTVFFATSQDRKTRQNHLQ